MDQHQNSGRERFQLLLQQIGLTDDAFVQFFNGAEIEKLTIERETKRWHFLFKLQQIIPANVHIHLRTQLTSTFAHIANVSFALNVMNPQLNEELVKDYWKHCLSELDGMSPALLSLLHNQEPKVLGHRLMVNARNATEVGQLKQKYSRLISEIYQSYGFPTLSLDAEVNTSEDSGEEYAKFLAEKQKEDEAKAFAALVEMQKKETDKASGADVPNGPVKIGYTIKEDADFRRIEQIIDEERRIAIEGYVFDAEVKELRSGRSLLTFKVTDYTSSILVKVFSRDKEDAAMLAQVKKGMWVRAQGSIQNDTFVRDLVMIANDINEISKVGRLDKAPENEKRVELHLHTPMSQMDAVTPTSALVAQAAKWGHKAIAITDHAGAQSFPEAFQCGEKEWN